MKPVRKRRRQGTLLIAVLAASPWVAPLPGGGLPAQAGPAAAAAAPGAAAPSEAPSAAPSGAPPGVDWRAYDRDAFAEARRLERPVFLLLTAPWNWDHFLLDSRQFADPAVAAALNERFVPVFADASILPELRPIYSLRSGLLPSLHFLDEEARPLASFPPLGGEELAFYLDEISAGPLPDPPERPGTVTFEINGEHFANRAARLILDELDRDDALVSPVHGDLDPSALAFLLEFATVRPRQDAPHALDRELAELLGSGLFDRVEGGFHRSAAVSDRSRVHHEKVLRGNVELGALFARWYRLSGDERFGAAALLTLRCLNERFRIGSGTLYAGSLAADVYDETGALVRKGSEYFALDGPVRRAIGVPPRSEDVPVGANLALQAALLSYMRTFRDERMRDGARVAALAIVPEALRADGLVRRTVGREAIGNLGDFADAGSGLLAAHALSGDPEALERARRVGEALLDQFDDGSGLFAGVARGARLPDLVRSTAPDARWNGAALRFLADLAALTREARWSDRVERGLAAWAGRIPWNARGVGQLGRAALRVEAPPPVILVVADPDTPSGRELGDLALRLVDPLALVRWVSPGDAATLARFGVDPAPGDPAADRGDAIHLVWDRTSRPIRDAVGLRLEHEAASGRVRPKGSRLGAGS